MARKKSNKIKFKEKLIINGNNPAVNINRIEGIDIVNIENTQSISFLLFSGKEIRWIFKTKDEADRIYSILILRLKIQPIN